MLLDSSHGALHAKNETKNILDRITTEAEGAGVTQTSLVELAAAVAWLAREIAKQDNPASV